MERTSSYSVTKSVKCLVEFHSLEGSQSKVTFIFEGHADILRRNIALCKASGRVVHFKEGFIAYPAEDGDWIEEQGRDSRPEYARRGCN